MWYIKKPIPIEAISFYELIALADSSINNQELTFVYKGHTIKSVEDGFLIPNNSGTQLMTKDDYLMTGVMGEIYPIHKDVLHNSYDIVPIHLGNETGEINE